MGKKANLFFEMVNVFAAEANAPAFSPLFPDAALLRGECVEQIERKVNERCEKMASKKFFLNESSNLLLRPRWKILINPFLQKKNQPTSIFNKRVINNRNSFLRSGSAKSCVAKTLASPRWKRA